jgi:gas vesicle protein
MTRNNPKKNSPNKSSVVNSGRSMEDLQEEMNNKLSALMEEVKSLAGALRTVQKENKELKQVVQNQADEIADLRNEINDREIHARSWSIRALNIPIPAGQESNNGAVMEAVYKELVAPILEGAKAKGDIPTVPPCHSLIEVAHILPGKSGKKPVIVRFFSRYWRSLLFKHRKEYAPREDPAPAAATSATRPAKMCFPFFEDLSRVTFKQLMTIQQHEQVVSAWTVSGIIRFKVKDSDTVHKVSSIYDTVDDIIS